MKALIVTSILMMNSLAWAGFPIETVHNCVGEQGQTLTVSVHENLRKPALTAKVVDQGQVMDFFTGYQDTPANFIVKSQKTGEEGKLSFAYPISYGGRCGRCAPEPDPMNPKSYVKIWIGEQEFTFTCHQN